MLRKRIVCADGFSFSCQASDGHYCLPRENNAIGYKSLEVGYPSQKPPDDICAFVAWSFEEGDWENSVYAQVPAALVLRLIEIHGGMISGELPPLSVE